MTPRLNSLIDHTLLQPDATSQEVARLCQEAAEHGFASVCVNPVRVRESARLLEGSGVAVCTVAGFPLGASCSAIKAAEAALGVEHGAREIDMVLDIGALKDGDLSGAEADVRAVRQALEGGVILKVILEVCLLSEEEIVAACRLCEAAGADFVKTSTGFGKSGATLESVRLMRATVGQRLGVKAAGGIRDRRMALAMIEAGASRIGASASVAIVSTGEEAGNTSA